MIEINAMMHIHHTSDLSCIKDYPSKRNTASMTPTEHLSVLHLGNMQSFPWCVLVLSVWGCSQMLPKKQFSVIFYQKKRESRGLWQHQNTLCTELNYSFKTLDRTWPQYWFGINTGLVHRIPGLWTHLKKKIIVRSSSLSLFHAWDFMFFTFSSHLHCPAFSSNLVVHFLHSQSCRHEICGVVLKNRLIPI